MISDTLKGFLVWLVALASLFFLLTICLSYPNTKVRAQDMSGHSHEGVVGQFYAKWMKADVRNDKGDRYQSCCSERDCKVRPIRQANAHWEYLSLYHKRWVAIPQEKLEQTYPDAEESPDGQSHVCEDPYTGVLYCVTLGSGT